MKKYLIVIKDLPNNRLLSTEWLELILTIAALEADLSVVFIGYSALLISQNECSSDNLDVLNQTINALALFNLENIYIEKNIVSKLQILSIDININFKTCTWQQLDNFYYQHDVIWCF